MKARPFDNVRNQIGYCGIWCGSCVAGNGALRELTRRYEAIVRGYGLEGWASKDFSFEEFMKGLASIQSMPLCEGCLKGDGDPDCRIRACASEKKIDECSECEETSACTNIDKLEKMRTGALDAGLLVKTENVDRKELIRKWTSELKKKWPCSILFT